MFVCKDQKILANILPKTIVEASVEATKKMINYFSISQFIATENRCTTSVFQCFTIYFQLNGQIIYSGRSIIFEYVKMPILPKK